MGLWRGLAGWLRDGVGDWGAFGMLRGIARLLTVGLDGMVWLWLCCCGWAVWCWYGAGT